ncbi:MAG TPA: hypothetical protein VJR92_10540 [Gemmatimonadaceae bacterium]|nr:hypothetical protein [Gemmatimonadaceae bacterium]
MSDHNAAVRVLLSHLVDYAGLFPPAQLEMEMAVRQYAAYRVGPSSWMLGRFVVPASRLDHFARAATPHLVGGGDPWRLSALLGDDPRAGADAVAAFNASHRGAICDSVEAVANSVDDVARIAGALRASDATAYVEIPVRDDPAPLVDVIRAHKLRAKIRTGGTTLGAFPAPADVVRFIAACIRAGIGFKATAGLHHVVRGEYALTYEDNSPRGTMHGFLNVFLATALIRDGGDTRDAEALLVERDASAFAFGPEGLRWRSVTFLAPRLAQLRDRVACSFGSCSFAEPVDELRTLRWV